MSALTLFTILLAGAASSGPDPGLTKSFAGCYQFSLGAWNPRLDLGADAKFVEVPSRVRLLTSRGKRGWEREGFLIRPLPGADPGRGEPSYWMPKSKDKVELLWNDGFTRVSMDLSRDGEVLRGIARTHWDFNRATQERSVVAAPVPCGRRTDKRAAG